MEGQKQTVRQIFFLPLSVKHSHGRTGRDRTNQAHSYDLHLLTLLCLACTAQQLSHVEGEQRSGGLPLGAQRLRRAARKGMMGMDCRLTLAERKGLSRGLAGSAAKI